MSYLLQRDWMSIDFGPYLNHTQLRSFGLPFLQALSDSECRGVLSAIWGVEPTRTLQQIADGTGYNADQTAEAIKKLRSGRILVKDELTPRRITPLMLTKIFVGLFEPIFFGGPHTDYDAILDVQEEVLLGYPIPEREKKLGLLLYREIELRLSQSGGWQSRIERATEVLSMEFPTTRYRSILKTIAQESAFEVILCCNNALSASEQTIQKKAKLSEVDLKSVTKRLVDQGILQQNDDGYSVCFDYLPVLASALRELFGLDIASIRDLLRQTIGIEHSYRKES
ncbi:MAG TPA: hypothetical protein VNG90_04090 [Candidatus Acidoferrum sp.]|nr:hypothetical protein [Candidatus Acidoferrum sp.]